MRTIGIWLLGGMVLAEEPATVVHPGESFEEGRTVVWTPVFQAGWDAMNAELGGPPEASGGELNRQLDHFRWKPEKVMPDDRWKVWAGRASTKLFEQVNTEAAEFLLEDEGPFQEVIPTRPNGIAFYSLLDAQVDFVTPFYESRKWPLKFKTADGEKTEVKFWGVAGSDSGFFRQSVRVLSWRPSREYHALELLCLDAGLGNVVLFLPPEPMSFSKACRWVRVWRGGWNEKEGKYAAGDDRLLHDEDRLRVPYLKFHSSADLAGRLKGARIYGNDGDPWEITTARQRVEFELDERGARVRAVAEGGMDPFSGGPDYVPRDFSFDRPFFVFLWRDEAAWPYFAAWVGDVEGMEKFAR